MGSFLKLGCFDLWACRRVGLISLFVSVLLVSVLLISVLLVSVLSEFVLNRVMIVF